MKKQTSSPGCTRLNTEMSDVFRKMRPFQLFVLTICALQIVIGLVQPYLVGRLVDSLEKPPKAAIALGGIMLSFIVVSFFLNYVQNFNWFKLIHLGTTRVRSKLFTKMLKNPASFFEKYPIGDLTNRILNDSSMYAQDKLISLPMILLNAIRIIGVFAFLIFMEYRVSAIVAVLCVIYFLAYLSMNRRLRESSGNERKEYSVVMNSAQETLTGIHTVRLFREENFFAARFQNIVENHFHFLMRMQSWKSLGQSATSAITELIPVIALLSCVYFIATSQITLGTAVSFYTFLPALWEPIRNMTDVNLAIQMSKSVESRLEELLADSQEAAAILPLPGQGSKPGQFQTLAIQNVNFAYQPEQPIYRELNLTFNRGDRMAVIGPSGCGKSTLIQLLLGRLKPNEGKILLNGQEIQNEQEGKLLSFTTMLPQEIFVFAGNMKENIQFGYEADEQRYQSTVSLSKLEQVPNTENAKEMSGGERQRIGLARALLRDPELLILDEPTAALDVTLEHELVDSLDTYLTQQQKSMIVISHRPEILRICNLILELKPNGEWAFRSSNEKEKTRLS